MTGLKISVLSKIFFCHKLVPEVSSFILVDFSGFVSLTEVYCEDFRTEVQFHKYIHMAPGS